MISHVQVLNPARFVAAMRVATALVRTEMVSFFRRVSDALPARFTALSQSRISNKTVSQA